MNRARSTKHLLSMSVVVAAWVPSVAQALTSADQTMAVPAYFYPGPYWAQVDRAGPSLGLAVVNPSSGPGTAKDPKYVATIRAAQSAGVKVIGYVDTDYAIRLVGAVKADIDTYYTWYGVDGIFFDRASTDCRKEAYYAGLSAYVKGKGGVGRTVLNPGTQTAECYARASDMLLTFEGSDRTYVSQYSAPSWTARYPASLFWHVVYSTAGSAALSHVVRLSEERHAGYLYVTTAGLPNPYGTLPTGTYWRQELSVIGS